ncbi:phosphoribosyl-AMP cyclohydrolase [Tistrella mobilis]|uniref:Phosphoribosyl-AMP cyclohydrolase n=1 Tax=Tistrella mobilis TaxID=171437 RepID=A0A162LX83_9PROT|nr:phosphoribosyl-AMP cyclohydrolase [Tistrella mobilis]
MARIHFNADGLVPAIAQDAATGEVLMMAWMNEAAVRETLATRRGVYWSRSRKGLWRKGESSGQMQHLKAFRIDCDGDTVLLLVDQQGVACHTGRRSCFFDEVNPETGDITTIMTPEIDPETLYGRRTD